MTGTNGLHSIVRRSPEEDGPGRLRFGADRPDAAGDRRVFEVDGPKPESFVSGADASRGLTHDVRRLVGEWVPSSDLMRVSLARICAQKAVWSYRRTANLRAVQLLLGTRDESTVRYSKQGRPQDTATRAPSSNTGGPTAEWQAPFRRGFGMVTSGRPRQLGQNMATGSHLYWIQSRCRGLQEVRCWISDADRPVQVPHLLR